MTQFSGPAADKPERIATGTLLADRYAVGEIVGYGGMSTVYHGRDTLLDRDVAIKVLNAPIGYDDSGRSAFLREARAAASLSHPAIVAAYDAGVFAVWPFIVMEYLSGESLKDLIDRRAPLPAETVAEIGETLADALQYGHLRGVVHCDVKPQNVLFDAAGRPKLVDFGISQTAAVTAALTTSISGTAAYVAPEQLEALALDGRADIYSLGTVLFQMLSRVLPFEAPNPTALATRRLVAEPRSLAEAAPGVPPALSAIVMRCLARRREDRFSSAGQLAAALHDYRQGLGYEERTLAARPSPLLRREATQVWRREDIAPDDAPLLVERRHGLFWPLVLVLTAILIALIVAVGVVVASRSGGATTVTVPPVTNNRLDDAADALHAAGLKVQVTLVPSDQPLGTVLSQQPAADSRWSTANPVTLTVSEGQQH